MMVVMVVESVKNIMNQSVTVMMMVIMVVTVMSVVVNLSKWLRRGNVTSILLIVDWRLAGETGAGVSERRDLGKWIGLEETHSDSSSREF